jgi:spore coat protein SA
VKKIAIITPGILPVPPVKGGAVETLVHQILIQNELHKRMDITVFITHDAKAVLNSQNYHHTNFVFIKTNYWMDKAIAILCRVCRSLFKITLNRRMLYIYKIQRQLNHNKFDKIVIENSIDFVLPISRKNDSEIYLRIHNDYLNENTPNHHEILEACSRILTVSDFLKNQVLSLENANNENVKVLKNCTDNSAFDKQLYQDYRKSFRDQHHINESDIVILFSGRLNPEKGIKELIMAFNMLDHHINAKLLIVGSTFYGRNDNNPFVNELIACSRDIKDKILFTGFIPHEDMPKVHAVADVAIVPSIWNEPAGLVVIEAMSSGLPLIATDSGGIWEYTDETCAINVKRDEKLIESIKNSISLLCSDVNLRNKMGQAGRGRVQQFNVDRYFQNFISLLEC